MIRTLFKYCFLVLLSSSMFICITQAQVLSDDCSNDPASEIIVTTSCEESIINAIIDSPIGLPALTSCNGITPSGEDGWFWFEAIADYTIVEFLNNDNLDVVVYVYSGACGALTVMDCTDEWTTENKPEGMSFVTNPGEIYNIRLARKTGTSGAVNGKLCVWSNVPENESCLNATNLDVISTTVTDQNFGMSNDGLDSVSCGSPLNNNDASVWYSFTAPTEMVLVSLDYKSNYYNYTPITLYASCGSPELDCYYSTDDPTFTTYSGLTCGSTYYINIAYPNPLQMLLGTFGSPVVATFDLSVVSMANPGDLSFSIDSTTLLSCFEDIDGSIYTTTTDGTSPYSYTWSNTAQTIDEPFGLGANTYHVTVTDANNCFVADSATISGPLELIISVDTVIAPSCTGDTDGQIQTTPTGGTAPYYYAWSNGESTNDIAGLLADTYSVTVTDANSCSIVSSVLVSDPAPLAFLVDAAINAGCTGETNGEIQGTTSGGNMPYTYLWSNAAATEDISGLGAGTYDVIVTDINNCTITDTIIIISNPNPTSDNMPSSTSCNGFCDGEASVIPSGGASPYSFEWMGDPDTIIFDGTTGSIFENTINDFQAIVSGLGNLDEVYYGFFEVCLDINHDANRDLDLYLISPDGTQVELATDLGGNNPDGYINTCFNQSAAVNIFTETPPFTGTYMPEVGTLNSFNNLQLADGTWTLRIEEDNSSGTDGILNSWSIKFYSPTINTDSIITNLCTGEYVVVVTDDNSCSVIDTVTVTEPAAINLTIDTVVDLSCNGDTLGQILTSVLNGISPYTYNWTNTAQATEDIINLGANDYSVTVTDANSCTAIDSATVSEPPAIIFTIDSIVDIVCYGDSTGQILATTTGGTLPHSYAWTNTMQTTEDITDLSADIYEVTITDLNGCTATNTDTVAGPDSLVFTIDTISNESCTGNNDGYINASTSGGGAPYIYTWSDPSQTTEDIYGLAPGSYIVTITDVNMCTVVDSATVSGSSPVSLTIDTVINPGCNSYNNGQIQITTSGGTLPYTYTWSNADTTEDITNLYANNYLVTVTDVNGCSISESMSLIDPPGVAATKVTIDASCGLANGTASVIVTQGVSPFIFQWSTGDTTTGITGIAQGSYSVTITDADSCFLVENLVVNETGLSINLDASVNVSCNGGTDGSIAVTAAGGTTPYNYLWDSGQTTDDISDLGVGTYTISVSDANSCTGTESFDITEPSLLSSSITGSNETQTGLCNGSADLTVNGGTPPYSFIWSNAEISEDLVNLCADTFMVTITDANTCSLIDSIVINTDSISMPQLTLIATDVSCYGECDANITASVTGGFTPYTFIWNDPLMQTDSVAIDLCKGTYFVTVNDNIGSEVVDSITILEPDELILNLTNSLPGCDSVDNGIVDFSVTGGVPDYTIVAQHGTVDYLSGKITDLTSGENVISVIDNGGCESSDTIQVDNFEPFIIDTVVSNATCIGNEDGEVSLSISGGYGSFELIWSTGDTSLIISELAEGEYFTTITSSNGCENILSFEIMEEYVECVKIPSAFTPNGNGENETWVIKNIDMLGETLIDISVYNRQGDRVFEYNRSAADYADTSNQWDGNFKGKELPHGSYIYVVNLNNGSEISKGIVTIVR